MTKLDLLLLKGYTWLAAPAPTPTPAPEPGAEIDTSGFMSAIATLVVPVLLAGLGVFAVARANKGEIGRVLTTGAVAGIGIVFIVGAGVFFFVGDDILGWFVTTK